MRQPEVDRKGRNAHRGAEMKAMALEYSTDAASLALLEDGAVRAAAAVEAGHRRSQELFPAAEQLLRGAGWALGEVEAFAVGRGPGSYTGLRVSLTAALGWALPERKTVWTASSAAARAAELFAARPEWSRVATWGAARRGTIWAGRFVREEGGRVRREGEWRCLPVGERPAEWGGWEWDEEGAAPKAEWVGRLFFAGQAGEEVQPVYLHPAVEGGKGGVAAAVSPGR